MDVSTELGLSLNEQEWNLLPPAELWQPHNNLDRINIMGNNNQFGLAFLDESCNMVETVFDNRSLFLVNGVVASSLLSGGLP